MVNDVQLENAPWLINCTLLGKVISVKPEQLRRALSPKELTVDGIVIVTSPQELVRMIVKKAYNMAGMMDIPVLGVVENYSYIECPDCGKKMQVFGESHIDEVAKELGIDVLGKMPLDPSFASKADEGKIYELDIDYIHKGIEVISKL